MRMDRVKEFMSGYTYRIEEAIKEKHTGRKSDAFIGVDVLVAAVDPEDGSVTLSDYQIYPENCSFTDVPVGFIAGQILRVMTIEELEALYPKFQTTAFGTPKTDYFFVESYGYCFFEHRLKELGTGVFQIGRDTHPAYVHLGEVTLIPALCKQMTYEERQEFKERADKLEAEMRAEQLKAARKEKLIAPAPLASNVIDLGALKKQS